MLQEVKELLVCKVCYASYGPDKIPCSLTCHHTFCAPCLQQLGPIVTCPVCRSQTQTNGKLTKNYALADIVHALAQAVPQPHNIFAEAWNLVFGMNQQSIDRVKAIQLLESELPKREKGPELDVIDEIECLLGYLYFERSGETWDSEDGKRAIDLWNQSRHSRRTFYLAAFLMYRGEEQLASNLLSEFSSFVSSLTTPDSWTLYLHASILQATDSKRAISAFQTAAEAGFAPAQWTLGMCYFEGIGVDQDKSKGVDFYKSASAQGDATAQYWLGLCYSQGDGVKSDTKKALDYFSRSATQGMMLAQRSLAELLDGEEAVYWYRLAAKNGDLESQFQLANLLDQQKTEKSRKEAQEWYKKAAKSGHVEAEKRREKSTGPD